MEADKIYREISALPPEAQMQVVDFIRFLKTRYPVPKESGVSRKGRIADSPFIGIWKDREDMKDSSRWVRNLRNTEWDRTS